MTARVLRLAIIPLLLLGSAHAQTAGSITGLVTDGTNGKPLAGVLVSAAGPAIPGEQTAMTDAAGAFAIPNLPAGRYKLAAVLDGYKTEVRTDLELGENVILRANLAIVPEVVQLEEVVVTGSRIRRKDLTAPAPVTVINREQIMTSGKLSIGDFLQVLPEQGNSTNTTVNNGGDGSTTISLRSLGAARTLVLIDGKRFISGVPGGGNLGDPGVDLNSIPAAAVERIEVLKDGASAVYGSDAIGGVVNIITRKRIDGVEVSLNGSNSQRNDGSVVDVSVLAGAANERGGFSFGVGYYKQGSMLAKSRGWAEFAKTYDYATGAIENGGSSRIPSGRVQIDPSTCTTLLCQHLNANPAYAGKGDQIFMPATSTPDPVNQPLVDGWRAYGDSDLYNFQAVNFLITPSQRYSLYSNGDYSLGDYAKAYFHATYVNRRSSSLLAPEPLATGDFGATLSGQNLYNPFGVDILDARRRLIEAGGRAQTQDIGTLHTFVGVKGTLPRSLPLLADWTWDLSVGYARNLGTYTTAGSINTQLTSQALGPSNAAGQCVDAAGTVIPNCTSANLFGPMTPAMIASLGGYTGVNTGSNQVGSFEANLGGNLFKLFSDRAVALGLGYGHREEQGEFTYNPISVQGYDSDFNGLNTAGSYRVDEGYAELNVPLVTGAPWIESLEAIVAYRLSHYSSFGSSSTYKVGARYTPVRDVTLRGTYSTGFRAPGITSLYGGQGPSAEAATDPCANTTPGSALDTQCRVTLTRGGGGAAASNNLDDNTQILSTVGGNTQLKPEKANIFTLGVVFEPRWVPGLSLTADYYDIEVKNNISAISTPVILAGCYPGADGTPLQAYCDLILRGADGKLRDVTDLTTNVGKISNRGIDLAGRYTLPTEVGRFGLQADVAILLKYDQTLGNGKVLHGRNTYDIAAGPVNPSVKFNLGASWALGGFDAAVRGRYVGGFHECADPSTGQSSGSGLCSLGTTLPVHHVPFYQTYDVRLGYRLNWDKRTTTIGIGVQNVFDRDPAPVYNTAAQTNSDPTTYDYLGRNFYAQLVQKF